MAEEKQICRLNLSQREVERAERACPNGARNTVSLKLYLPEHREDEVKRAVDTVLDSADIFTAVLCRGEDGWRLSYGGKKISECSIEKERPADWVDGYMNIADRLSLDTARHLYRANVFPLSGGGVFLYVRFHHIIIDGYGMSLFVQRVLDVLAGKEIVRSEFQAVGGLVPEEYSDEREFWKAYFADAEFDASVYSRKAPGEEYASYRDRIPEKVMSGAEAYGERENVSIPCLFATAYAFYLAQATDKKDAVFLMPCLNRTPEQMDTLGCYALLVPVRVRVDAEDTFAELCRKVKAAAGEASAHRAYGFDRILSALREENIAGDSVSEYMFHFCHFSYQADFGYSVSFSMTGDMPNHMTFHLLSNEKGGMDMQFDYQEGVYTKKGVRKLCEAVITILSGGIQEIAE